METKDRDNLTNQENFAKFVLVDNSKSNKRKDIIFLIIITLLTAFCFYKEFKLNRFLDNFQSTTETIYTADTGDGTGNAVINDNGSEVIINGESNKDS